MEFAVTFQQLCDHARQTALLQSTMALLEWDQYTKLPAGASEYRSQQVTCLAGLIHQRSTDPQLGEWLDALESRGISDADQVADPDVEPTIRELRKRFDRLTRLPADLVEELARATSTAQTMWVEARKQNDYRSFEPQLARIFKLKQEQADAIGYQTHPYDALLDEYEPGATTAEVTQVLQGLCQELVPLVASIKASSFRPRTELLHQDYPTEQQRSFGREVSEAIGFDYQRGRLDVTHHPFCTELGPNDCRITTRYNPRFFNTAFFGTLHEAGHGIYEQGLRSDQYGLPLGSYCSLGVHESQSRLWENRVGRSLSFWKHFFPKAQQAFPRSLKGVGVDDFYGAVNSVAPSLVRVEADEATYDLHIIIRFELEEAILSGDLRTADLPAAWNEKYQKYLGVVPSTDSDGVLQDVHWAAGLVGYFPTYSLGNLYASQMYEAAENELGDLDSMFEAGEFQPLKGWLNQNVHQLGRRLSGPELGKQVTRQPLGHAAMMRYLNRKFAAIYSL